MGLTITVTECADGIYAASAEFLGVPFAASGRADVSGKLMRQLVEAGLPDQPWEVRGEDGRLRMTGPSSLVRAGMQALESDGGLAWAIYAPPPGQQMPAALQAAADAYRAARAARRDLRQRALMASVAQSGGAGSKAAGGNTYGPHGGVA